MRHNVLSERRRYMLHVHHPFRLPRLVHTRAYENIPPLWTRLCRPRSRVRDADDYVGRYLGTCNCSLVSPTVPPSHSVHCAYCTSLYTSGFKRGAGSSCGASPSQHRRSWLVCGGSSARRASRVSFDVRGEKVRRIGGRHSVFPPKRRRMRRREESPLLLPSSAAPHSHAPAQPSKGLHVVMYM